MNVTEGRIARGFVVTRFRAGYAIDEVDDFLDLIEAALAGRAAVSPKEVRDVRFSIRWLGRGYDQREVDDLLDEVERELRRAEG